MIKNDNTVNMICVHSGNFKQDMMSLDELTALYQRAMEEMENNEDKTQEEEDAE